MTLQEIQIEFLQNLKRKLDETHKSDGVILQQDLKEACQYMQEYQKQELVIPVETISITFLNTSYHMEKPKVRILFFAQKKLWEEPLMYMDFDAAWLVRPLEEYKKQLEVYAGNEKKGQEWVAVEARSMLRLLLKLTSYFIKYDVMECAKSEEIQGLFKCREFLISFGEYMDWQLPLYMEREAIDIFQSQEQREFQYREFKDMTYFDKTFENSDFTGARFLNCRFKKCQMKDVIWNDVTFKNCIFEEVSAEGGSIFGTRYEDCLFRQCIERNVKREVSEETEVSGFFRFPEWLDCEVEDGIF